MDLSKLNKKRYKITIFSIIVTILILAMYVLSVLFFSSKILISILGFILVLVALYCFSKFVVIKLYNKLKVDVIKQSISNHLQLNSININKNNREYVYHFFDKSLTNIKNEISLVVDQKQVDLVEFELTKKRAFKSDKITLAGKLLVLPYDFLDNSAYVLNYDEQTSKFVEYFKYFYKNSNTNYVSLKGNKQYIALYNDNFDKNVINRFDKFKGFNSFEIKDGKLYLLYLDKTPIFDFKLQNSITSNTINYCYECYEQALTYIKKFLKEEK